MLEQLFVVLNGFRTAAAALLSRRAPLLSFYKVLEQLIVVLNGFITTTCMFDLFYAAAGRFGTCINTRIIHI